MIAFSDDSIDVWPHAKTASTAANFHLPSGIRSALTRAAIAAGVLLGATPSLMAEHARIDLRVSGAGKEAAANADEEPPSGGRNDPPVLKVKVNEPLVLQFILTNTYPHRVIDHVTVRYYVVRVAKLGRKPPPMFRDSGGTDEKSLPLLEDGVVTKGEFIMNFKPDCRVGTRLKFQIAEPGFYSARVETINTQSDHEHFSAIDLTAE
jgi:hypothetical protein